MVGVSVPDGVKSVSASAPQNVTGGHYVRAHSLCCATQTSRPYHWEMQLWRVVWYRCVYSSVYIVHMILLHLQVGAYVSRSMLAVMHLQNLIARPNHIWTTRYRPLPHLSDGRVERKKSSFGPASKDQNVYICLKSGVGRWWWLLFMASFVKIRNFLENKKIQM